MDIKKLINELAISVYVKKDITESSRIYNQLNNEETLSLIKKDIYLFVPIISYYIMIGDTENMKNSIDYLDQNKDLYSKYELYFKYYFDATYQYMNSLNYQAALFTVGLIDLKKYRRYIKCDYKDYFYGMILLFKGSVYTYTRQYKLAHNSYEECLTYFKNDDAHARRYMIQDKDALVYINEGKFNKARDIYYDILKNDPDPTSTAFLLNISLLELFLKNYKKALYFYSLINTDFDKNNMYNIKLSNSYYYQGSLLYYYLGEYKQSKECLNLVDLETEIKKKDGLRFNKVLSAFVNKDYRENTVDYIKNAYSYFKDNFEATNVKLCELYFEELSNNNPHIKNVQFS